MAEMAGAYTSCSRPISLCAGTNRPEALPAACSARDDGQRQAHPREPGYRHSVGCSPLLLPCWLGATPGTRVSRIHGLPRSRTDHSLELAAAAFGLENCARPGNG